jgi:competence protein ComEA
MGRHSHHHCAPDQGPAEAAWSEVDWEEPPPPAPLWRTRIVTPAVLLLAVLAGTWWAVSWLTSPAGPGGAGTPEAAPVHGSAGVADSSPPGPDPAPREPARAGSGTPPATHPADADGGTPGEQGSVTVHVAGEVEKPGLVELPAGARIADALKAAGGATAEAELDLVNLAAPALDASQILVPGPETVAGPGDGASNGAVPPRTGDAAGAAGAAPGEGAVNINTADAATLEQLPGIGPALASRIVDHRNQVGPFASMEDLDAVSGIGPAMMERLDGLVAW